MLRASLVTRGDHMEVHRDGQHHDHNYDAKPRSCKRCRLDWYELRQRFQRYLERDTQDGRRHAEYVERFWNDLDDTFHWNDLDDVESNPSDHRSVESATDKG